MGIGKMPKSLPDGADERDADECEMPESVETIEVLPLLTAAGSPKKKIKKNNWAKWRKHAIEVLSIVSDISGVLIHLRAKPKPSDWIAIGLKSANIGYRIHEYYQNQTSRDSNEFFHSANDDPEGWVQVGEIYGKYIAKHVVNTAPVIGYSTELYPVQVGQIDKFDVAFSGKNASDLTRFFVRRKDYHTFLKKLCEYFWNDLGTNFVHYTGKLQPDELDIDDSLITPQVEKLRDRVQRFIDNGQHRSYLIEGVPGSGKSTAVKMVAKMLNMRTMRLDFTALDTLNYLNIRNVLSTIRPEVIIIDDMDRSRDNSIPIPLIEEWREHTDVIFVTVNHMTAMADAMLRPGRLDDHVRFDTTDEETVKEILEGEDLDLVGRLSKWPIAYVTDFVRRRDAFGSEQAREELDSLDPATRMARLKANDV